MSQLISPGPGSLHYTARQSNSRRTSPDFGWKARGMCKSGICDTKPAMSLKQSSLEPNLLQSVYRNSCTVCWLVTNLGWTLAYFSREQNFSVRDVSHFLLEHNEICHIRGSRRQHGLLVNFTIAYCCDLFIVVQTCWRSIVNGCQSRVIRLSLRSGHLTGSNHDEDLYMGRYFNTFTFCAYSTLECSWSREWWWLQLSSAWS